MIKKLWPYTRGYRKWIFTGILCSGSEEPVLLLSESGDYSGTIEVGGGSVYLGVWAVGVTGSVSIQIE